jgi:aminopeptidase N
VALNGGSTTFKNDGKKLVIYNDFQADTSYKLNFIFFAAPKKAMYFVGWDTTARNQIWTQGQGKYTSNWLPSIDDMNDKIEFDITYAAPKKYEVIANGKLLSKSESATYNLWQFDMQKPMSSYLVAVVLGRYKYMEATSKSGIPLKMYYYPEDSLKAEPTYRYTKRMFDFLEKEIGVAYPWQNYKQVPVHDFLYAGMENTSLTIFSDMLVTDSIGFKDENYVNVNAHELAHQWFGDLVTETSGMHHWLQEGFATYYALMAERDIFGDNYYYWRLYQYTQELLDQDRQGQGTALLDPKASSTTFYKRGALALHVLREHIGDVAFKKAVKRYLQKHQFANVETKDFIIEAERASEKDLSSFVKVWLENKAFPNDAAMESLKKSAFIQEYLMTDCEAYSSKCDYYLTAGVSNEAKARVVKQIPERVTSQLFDENIFVRQAIAENLMKVPQKLKAESEGLLGDSSYKTKEAALYNLWQLYPENRAKYLDKIQDVIGFSNKNVRLLWLTLALYTKDYKEANKPLFYKELVGYTAPKYNFEIRQMTFNYLRSLNVFNTESLKNLTQASKHYNWRLKKYAKNLIEELSKNPEYKAILQAD